MIVEHILVIKKAPWSIDPFPTLPIFFEMSFVTIGTPLTEQQRVPLHEQLVKDADGRVRLHGTHVK